MCTCILVRMHACMHADVGLHICIRIHAYVYLSIYLYTYQQREIRREMYTCSTFLAELAYVTVYQNHAAQGKVHDSSATPCTPN